MPSMMEIYQNNALEYDELVSHEDYQNNLGKQLDSVFDFKNKNIIELGGGTGRVTKLYIARSASVILCDGSAHMLEKARKNLGSDKIRYKVMDNLEYSPELMEADLVIEGWSFGHTVKNNTEPVKKIVGKLISSCRKMLKPDGQIIIIESLGTNRPVPQPPDEIFDEFFDLLENSHGFKRYTVSTDYKFDSPAEAQKVMGFFFGPRMEEAVRNTGMSVIPEFTGIWILQDT